MVIIFDSFPVNALPDDDTLDALGQVAMTVFEHTGRAYPPTERVQGNAFRVVARTSVPSLGSAISRKNEGGFSHTVTGGARGCPRATPLSRFVDQRTVH